MAVVTPPTQFWVFNGKSPQGPYAIPQIHAMLKAGDATWGTKVCPVGETQWIPLHCVPGLIPDAQQPPGARPVRTIVSPSVGATRQGLLPAVSPPPLQPRNPQASRFWGRVLLGSGVAATVVVGCIVIHLALTNSFDGYERGYSDTILRYVDRPYEGAKWTQLKETTSFSEMVTLGNSPVTELFRVAGWDDNNLWVANQTGQVFQLRDGHWQFAAKPDNAAYPSLRVIDQSTLLIAGGVGGSHLYRLSPGNVADIGAVDRSADGELFQANSDLLYSYRAGADPIRFADGVRTVLKVELFKEATVHRADNTPLKDYLVGAIRHVRPFRPGLAYSIASPHYGKKKLVRFENGYWQEFADLPDKDIKDVWLSGSVEAPYAVLVGKLGWVYVQPAKGAGAERTLATSPDTTPMNLIKVWGVSPDKFWVMDEHGTVWELNRTESRIVVRGMRRDDVTFRDAWASPTGDIFAITNKLLYRLD